MSGRDDPRLPARTVDYIQDLVGADVPRDLIRVALVAQDLGQLDVSAAEVDVNLNNQSLAQVASNIDQIGGQAQSAVDVANKIDQINAALASVGDDSLQVSSPSPLDVSAAEVDVDIATQSLTPLTVTDNGSLSLSEYTGGNLPISLEAQNVTPLTVTDDGSLNIAGVVTIQEDTPLDVSAATVPTDPNASDSDSLNAATLAANGELTMSLSSNGATEILGQANSSGQFDVLVRWFNSASDQIREETIQSGASAGQWYDINIPAKSAEAEIVISDTSGAEQTVDATVHSG